MTRHPLHRGGFPPIDPATIGKAFADGRAYKRLTGPARHVRIEPPINWRDLFCKAVIIAGAGGVVALWVGVL